MLESSYQGLEDALGSSTHHFLAWSTSDQPAVSYNTQGKNCIVLPCQPAKFHLYSADYGQSLALSEINVQLYVC